LYGGVEETQTLDVDFDISVRIDEDKENSTPFQKVGIPK